MFCIGSTASLDQLNKKLATQVSIAQSLLSRLSNNLSEWGRHNAPSGGAICRYFIAAQGDESEKRRAFFMCLFFMWFLVPIGLIDLINLKSSRSARYALLTFWFVLFWKVAHVSAVDSCTCKSPHDWCVFDVWAIAHSYAFICLDIRYASYRSTWRIHDSFDLGSFSRSAVGYCDYEGRLSNSADPRY